MISKKHLSENMGRIPIRDFRIILGHMRKVKNLNRLLNIGFGIIWRDSNE